MCLFNQNKHSNETALDLFKSEGFSGAALGLVGAIIQKIDKKCFYWFKEIAGRSNSK